MTKISPVTILFDTKSFCRYADVTISGELIGDGEDATDAIRERALGTTHHQDDTLRAINDRGLLVSIDEDGKITGQPAPRGQLIVNHCDKGHQTTSPVRRLPTGGGGASILCHPCYLHEMAYRRDRNQDPELNPANHFETPKWDELEVYDGSS